MLIALLLTILGGGQIAPTIFEIPKFDVLIKETVEDKDRKRTLLHVYYEAQASLSAHKTYQKKHRSVALSANRNEWVSRDTLNMILESGTTARKQHQEKMIKHGLYFREHITDQEWNAIFVKAFKTPKNVKKQVKQRQKAQKRKEKAFTKLTTKLDNLSQIKLSKDSAKNKTIGDLTEFQAMYDAFVMLKEQNLKTAAEREAFWKSKDFPIEEVKAYFDRINSVHETVKNAFLDARFAIQEHVTSAHWLSISKDLAKLFE